MQALIEHLELNGGLSPHQVNEAVDFLADESADADLKADFLRALRAKGESAEEIAAFVRALLDRAVEPEFDPQTFDHPVIDVCGTGGDKMDLFNISTASMFLVAAGGAAVVKHGNRGITSPCGGADVLEALGVRIDLSPERFGECVRQTGLGFLFAPAWHPAFKAIVPVRKRLAAEGVPTIFNLLGPLLNPVRPPFQLIGVFSPLFLEKFAETLRLLGRERAWVVNGEAPEERSVDEISTMGLTRVCEMHGGEIRKFEINATEFGLPLAGSEQLRGGDRETNASIVHGILKGEIQDARRDVVALNAAAALTVAGLAGTIADGLELARRQLEDGEALRKLAALREFTSQ